MRLRILATLGLAALACTKPPPAAPDAGTVAAVALAARPPTPPDGMLRFVALGDQGKGNEAQFAVGRAVASVCEARGGCAFGILLGDNFYPSGVASTSDPQWQTAFEQPYAPVPFAFWAVLGNHDYGGNGGGYEVWRSQNELDYAKVSPRWRMPDRHYAFADGPADFIALDTNAIVWGRDEAQAAATDERIAAATRGWRFVLGHHPYQSNGRHGDAGIYDQRCALGTCTCTADALRIPCGVQFKRFFDAHVCGKADVYLAGHDHNLQDLGPACGVQLFVSGAGASTTALVGQHPAHFQSSASGFFVFEVDPSRIVATAFDRDAKQLHTRTIERGK